MALAGNRPDPPAAADERTTLHAFLQLQRATLRWKVAGVSDDDARRPAVPTSTLTLAGLVRHLTSVERSWFRSVVAGEEVDHLAIADDRDAMRVAPGERLADLVAAYEIECAEADAAVATVALDDVAVREGHDVTLRWVLCHMVEETARHNGHADLLREAIDGATGE